MPAIKTADDTKRAFAALEKAKARLTPRAYAQAKEQIKTASKALAGPKDDGLASVRRRGLHLRIGTDGTIEVRHSTDRQLVENERGQTVCFSESEGDTIALLPVMPVSAE